MSPIRLVIADDHPVVRSGLSAMFSSHDDLVVVAEAADGSEAITLCRRHEPDVLLLDFNLPDQAGSQVAEILRDELPAIRVAMLTVSVSACDVRDAVEAGAVGYLLKDSSSESLVRAVRKVHSGGLAVDERVASAVGPCGRGERLTEREAEILRMMAAGKKNREIAQDLHIGVATVKTHSLSVFRKLGVASRTRAVLAAAKQGLIRIAAQ